MTDPAIPLETSAATPFVSVVTPFYNTAPYLGECIESVLAQSHANFEYILVDNCSTDGSGEIAEQYAGRDPRIRVVHRTQLLPQVQNYNAALTEISPDSKYCKIVQADDYIFSDCLRLMVEAFGQSATIGLVSSYSLAGDAVQASGYPFPRPVFPGRDCARWHLRTGGLIFGTPTTVMYRSAIVRDQRPFFNEAIVHDDFDKCLQILRDWDFGFVHQILSFTRIDNESLYFGAGLQHWRFSSLTRYSLVLCYAPVFFEEQDEAEALTRDTKRIYYDVLAAEALKFRGSAFWRYHREGLKSIGESLDLRYLAWRIVLKLLRSATNPGTAAASVFRVLRAKAAPRTAAFE